MIGIFVSSSFVSLVIVYLLLFIGIQPNSGYPTYPQYKYSEVNIYVRKSSSDHYGLT